ncbi:hypothetical protein ES703_23391 [subsurface metagenome]
MRIEVSQLPPISSSPNWRGHWAQRYIASRIYHNAVFYCCVDARNKALGEGTAFPFVKARLNLTFVFPEYRRRDRDNTLSRAKPGIDAIVASGLVIDDDAEHLEIGKVEVEVDKGRAPLTIIELEEWK